MKLAPCVVKKCFLVRLCVCVCARVVRVGLFDEFLPSFSATQVLLSNYFQSSKIISSRSQGLQEIHTQLALMIKTECKQTVCLFTLFRLSLGILKQYAQLNVTMPKYT